MSELFRTFAPVSERFEHMQFIDTVLSYCGWTGVALAAVLLLMLGIQRDNGFP